MGIIQILLVPANASQIPQFQELQAISVPKRVQAWRLTAKGASTHPEFPITPLTN